MIKKTFIAIGGGEIKSKTTLKIDEFVAKIAKIHAGKKRAYGLFVGTASHDSMPYFNSFRKTYTSVFDVKADCALTVYGEMNFEKIKEKFLKADFIYIGGGNTIFMLEEWKKSGLDKLILDAYNRGVIIVGLSAGAIFAFEKMYTDSSILNEYKTHEGMSILPGYCSPHYDLRITDFDREFILSKESYAYGIEADCAVLFVNGIMQGAISSGKNAYVLRNNQGKLEKFKISQI